MHKYKVALFIGRFQPFHNGHLYSLNRCLEIADKVIVAVGSSQEKGTESNPWDFERRSKMILSVNPKVEVVAIPDLFNDEKWGDQILFLLQKNGLEKAGVVGVGNNDWTNRIFRSIGIDVYETGLYQRDELEGIIIRELIKNGDNRWKGRVPGSVVKWLEEYELSK